jgi:hypothetical protein
MAAEHWNADQVSIWIQGIGGPYASSIGTLFRSLNVDGAALFALNPTSVDTLFARTNLGVNVTPTGMELPFILLAFRGSCLACVA